MGANKYEDAGELFENAATKFKLAKNWARAERAYSALHDCRTATKETHDAASAIVESASMCKKMDDVAGATTRLRRACELYAELGRLSQAAKHLKEIGELLEKEEDFEGAIAAYAQAADLYDGEESSSTTANNCKLKVATLSAKLERYERATEIFEDVARASLENNLLRFSAKGYFLQAGMCRLCWNDPIGVLNAIERYEESDPGFASSREHELLRACAKAAENGDQEEFSQAVVEFDSMSRLDAWKTTILLRAKKRIEKAVAEEEDDLT